MRGIEIGIAIAIDGQRPRGETFEDGFKAGWEALSGRGVGGGVPGRGEPVRAPEAGARCPCSGAARWAGGRTEERKRGPTTLRTDSGPLPLWTPPSVDPTTSSCHTPQSWRALRSCPFIALEPKLGPLHPDPRGWLLALLPLKTDPKTQEHIWNRPPRGPGPTLSPPREPALAPFPHSPRPGLCSLPLSPDPPRLSSGRARSSSLPAPVFHSFGASSHPILIPPP